MFSIFPTFLVILKHVPIKDCIINLFNLTIYMPKGYIKESLYKVLRINPFLISRQD